MVELDEACRKQQLGEGWFSKLEDVPDTAISMSIRQIMKSGSIICTVSEKRKALAVKNALEGGIHRRFRLQYLQKGSGSSCSWTVMRPLN